MARFIGYCRECGSVDVAVVEDEKPRKGLTLRTSIPAQAWRTVGTGLRVSPNDLVDEAVASGRDVAGEVMRKRWRDQKRVQRARKVRMAKR